MIYGKIKEEYRKEKNNMIWNEFGNPRTKIKGYGVKYDRNKIW